jgi:hypothetical protein
MIVSHYQKKNILLFCRSSPINHNLLPGKSTARCSFQEWSQHLQPSSTADVLTEWRRRTESSWHCMLRFVKIGPPRSQAEQRGFAQLAVRSGLPLLICMIVPPRYFCWYQWCTKNIFLLPIRMCVPAVGIFSYRPKESYRPLPLLLSSRCKKIRGVIARKHLSLPRPSCSCS